MAWRLGLRAVTAVIVCVFLSIPAFPQIGSNLKIGPSEGEVIGVIAGTAAVLGITGYLIYRSAHRHSSIQGCVNSDQGGLSLRNEKDKKTYVLLGDATSLQTGQRVALRGKKRKDSSGKASFEVQKLEKNLGECPR